METKQFKTLLKKVPDGKVIYAYLNGIVYPIDGISKDKNGYYIVLRDIVPQTER